MCTNSRSLYYDNCERSSVFLASFLRISPTFCAVFRTFLLSNWRICILRVGKHETTPRVTALWLGRKKTKIFWHQSEARTAPTVWNWSVKTLSPGALTLLLDFSSPEYFFGRLDFSPPPLTAPGSPRMKTNKCVKNAGQYILKSLPSRIRQSLVPRVPHSQESDREMSLNVIDWAVRQPAPARRPVPMPRQSQVASSPAGSEASSSSFYNIWRSGSRPNACKHSSLYQAELRMYNHVCGINYRKLWSHYNLPGRIHYVQSRVFRFSFSLCTC